MQIGIGEKQIHESVAKEVLRDLGDRGCGCGNADHWRG
jgi:hypothetical protein